jgi:hypothetical protein
MNRNIPVLLSGSGLLIYTLYDLARRVTRLEYDVVELYPIWKHIMIIKTYKIFPCQMEQNLDGVNSG